MLVAGFPAGAFAANCYIAATALIPISQRLRTSRCLAIRTSCWRRYFSLACLRWRSFLPATGRILLGLLAYLATAGIHGRQAHDPDAYL